MCGECGVWGQSPQHRASKTSFQFLECPEIMNNVNCRSGVESNVHATLVMPARRRYFILLEKEQILEPLFLAIYLSMAVPRSSVNLRSP
jgi:hypothetical protein